MRKVTIKSSAIINGDKTRVVLALTDGQVLEEEARAMGMLIYTSKDSGESFFYYNHPTNVMAIRVMTSVFKANGFDPNIVLENAAGVSIQDIMHQRVVPYYSSRFGKCFDPDSTVRQADIAVDKMVISTIAKHHPRLASAAILTLIDDYDPEEMKDKLRRDPSKGEVWAYVRRASGVEKKHTGYDFCIHLCKTIWDRIDLPTKGYVIDHELSHCGVNQDTGRWEMWQHDIQTFASDIAKYGGKIKEVDALVGNIINLAKRRKKTRKDSDKDDTND